MVLARRWRAGRSPCPCPRRPTGRRGSRSRASLHSFGGSAGRDRTEMQRAPATAHRGSCDHTLRKAPCGPAPAPRIVSGPWTRSSSSPTATPAPPTRSPWSCALAMLREQRLGRGAGDLQPRRARRRAAPGRVPADRGRRRRRQPARRDRRAAPPQRPQGRRPRPAAARHRQRLRPRHRHPPRHRGGRPGRSSHGEVRPMDLVVDEVGEVVVNSVHVGAGRQRQPPRRPLEGAARLGRGRQGQPRQARLPDRRRC